MDIITNMLAAAWELKWVFAGIWLIAFVAFYFAMENAPLVEDESWR